MNSLMTKLICVLTLSFCLYGCDSADEPDPFRWQSFGLDGKRVFELTISEDFLYAAAGKDGLFRKDLGDERNQWEFLGLADPEVSFGVQSFYQNSEAGIMYAAFYEPNYVGNGVFRSTDDGKNWEPFDEGIILNPGDDRNAVVLKLAASISKPDQIIAGTVGGIFIKQSGENTWTYVEKAPGFNTFSIAFNPQNASRIWIGGDDDRGTARLAVTNDGGTSWSENSSIQEIAQFTDTINEISHNPENPGILYVCLDGKIAKSVDGGENWNALQSGDITEENFIFFSALRINPINPDEIIAAGKFLYSSIDAGISWSIIDSTKTIITDLQIDWDKRVVYGAILNPERGVYKIAF